MRFTDTGRIRRAVACLGLCAAMTTGCNLLDGRTGHSVDHVGDTHPSPADPSNAVGNIRTGNTANDRLSLQRIQIVSNGVIFVLTHGDMLQVYERPHITGGSTPTFVVTLRNVSPGTYPLNHPTPVHARWATEMTLSHVGADLRAAFKLHPGIKNVLTSVGFGDTIQFTLR